MNILLLTQVVPYPPDSGPKIKTYHVLRYLAQRHTVHLLSFVRSSTEEANALDLGDVCASVTTVPLRRSLQRDVGFLAKSLVTGRPFLIERDNCREMHDAVHRLLGEQQFDAVHADQLSMAQYAVDQHVPCRVLDEHNAVWTIVRRAAGQERRGLHRVLASLEWRKLRAYEGDVCRRFDRVTVVSERDLEALMAAAGCSILASVVPIAVDTEQLAFQPPSAEARNVVSVATMFYPPNVEGIDWFARRVFPIVRRAAPDTKFFIVGSRPPERIVQLASATSGIVVTGYVPDLDPILHNSAALVVPVHVGSGLRVKILESFARGIPVISTTVGAEGIAARHAEHLLIADDPQAFADAVILSLRDRPSALRRAAAGRTLVETQYDWRSALQGLDSVYDPARASRAPEHPVVGAGVARSPLGT